MDSKYPRRTQTHVLEELSERFFRDKLPENWIAERPGNSDYGIDLKVDIFYGENATGLELLVQLKSSANSSNNDYESIRLKQLHTII